MDGLDNSVPLDVHSILSKWINIPWWALVQCSICSRHLRF